jgi:hypothetical protein
MMMRKRQTWIAIAALALGGAGILPMAAHADTVTMTGLSPGQASVANRVAAPFSYFAGSPDNAVALANALRNGTTATLTYTTTTPGSDSQTTNTDITVSTRPMGWGNVSHALALAQFSLHQAGIDQPTSADLQAALNGGTVTNANGQTTTLAGVLQQRASGMGWGRIAQSYGTTMGAVNRGIQTSFATTASTSGSTTPTMSGTGVTTASPNTSTRGVTTASGTTTGTSSGVVSANGTTQGQGHAYGRGIVTASGASASPSATTTSRGPSSSGVITGNGSASSVANAASGNGSNHAGGNGNGKGKGGG